MEAMETAAADDAGSPPVSEGTAPGSTPGATPDASGSPEAQTSAGSTPTGGTAEGSDELPTEWKNFLGKYTKDGKTDYKAAAGSYWNASKVYKENETLKAELAKLRTAPPTPQEPPKPEPPPPQVAKLQERIQSFETRKAALTESRTRLVQEARQLDDDRKQAKWELDRADEMDKPHLALRLQQIQTALDAKVAEWKRAGDSIEDIDERAELFRARLEAAQQEAEVEKERQAQAAQEAERFNTEFPQHIDSLIAKAAEGFKPLGPAGEGSIPWKVANALLMGDLWRAKDAPTSSIDFEATLGAHLKELSEYVESRARELFAEQSKERLAVTKPMTPAPKPVVSASPATDPRRPSWQDPANGDWRDLPQYRRARGEAV